MRRYPFGKFLLDIPDDHRIVEIHRQAALYDRSYGFILEAIAAERPSATFLDIGANVGDTAALIATHTSNPIVSVEGDGHYLGYLLSNLRYLGSQVRVIDRFVRTSSLADVPLAYQRDEGSGSMATGGGVAVESDRFIGLDELLDEVGELAMVKTDTDGLDGFIVDDLLARQLDVPLFFECDTMYAMPEQPNPWPSIFARMDDHAVLIFDNQGLPMLLCEEGAGRALRDLSGYVHLQRCVLPVRTHYLDVWSFPRSWLSTFRAIAERLRGDLLKPYLF